MKNLYITMRKTISDEDRAKMEAKQKAKQKSKRRADCRKQTHQLERT